MRLKTYLAVGELAQAAAHHHGLTGPVPFTVCGTRNYDWCDLDDDYIEVEDLDDPADDRTIDTAEVDDFFYAQHAF